MVDSLLAEVDADLRQEKLARLWQQLRKPLALAAVAVVIIATGSTVWRAQQEKKAAEAMRRLDAGIVQLQNENPQEAVASFTALASASTGELHDLARLWQARAQAEAGKAEDAVQTLADLAANPHGRDLIWRDLACLRLMAANHETPKTCAAIADSPLAAERLEWQAALAWKAGRTDDARAMLTRIAADEQAGEATRTRATQLLHALDAGVK